MTAATMGSRTHLKRQVGFSLARLATTAERVRVARTCERLGYDYITLPDHPSRLHGVFTSAANVAAITRIIGVRLYALNPSLRDPRAVVAEIGVLLDLLGPRLQVAVGLGSLAADSSLPLPGYGDRLTRATILLGEVQDAFGEQLSGGDRLMLCGSRPEVLAAADRLGIGFGYQLNKATSFWDVHSARHNDVHVRLVRIADVPASRICQLLAGRLSYESARLSESPALLVGREAEVMAKIKAVEEQSGSTSWTLGDGVWDLEAGAQLLVSPGVD